MIGVVVWSSSAREKAVIWCEDHASLAYLQGSANLLDPASWPEPGDLLELESEMIGDLRHARRVSVLSEQGFPHLPELLSQAQPSPVRDTHLRVVATRDRIEGDAHPQPEFARLLRVGAGR
ncbi:hypothetical protein [Paracoccus salsus]|uniref:hypothetical protein n=1 Tax=Paracoccus salsus TaxID=2911061 RepID=UPI001F20E600|nr:hypothetical protein [Paracoccus salsus]MCF3972789.1 hypothetical protein [Paracoccus salsus]